MQLAHSSNSARAFQREHRDLDIGEGRGQRLSAARDHDLTETIAQHIGRAHAYATQPRNAMPT